MTFGKLIDYGPELIKFCKLDLELAHLLLVNGNNTVTEVLICLRVYVCLCTKLSPLQYRQHLSNGDCLEDKRVDYQNCSVAYCILYSCAQ